MKFRFPIIIIDEDFRSENISGSGIRDLALAIEGEGIEVIGVDRVEKGTALADRAGTTMHDIVASIQRVSDIVGEISSASAEQSAGVAQVGEAITQMDQATQQNAALVEESAAAADSMRVQAQQLVEAVAVFKLSDQRASVAGPSIATAQARAALGSSFKRTSHSAKPALASAVRLGTTPKTENGWK